MSALSTSSPHAGTLDTPKLASRSVTIDALKFFAITLVVIGHVIDLPKYGDALRPLRHGILTFNMPLFMLLAGYVLFGREGAAPVRFIQRKFLALMVPYFAWTIFQATVRSTSAGQWANTVFSSIWDPQAGPKPWFLYVLFLFYVMFTLVRLVSKRDLALVGLAALTISITFLPNWTLLGRQNVEWLFTFFVAGYLIAKHRDRIPRPNWLVVGAFALAYAGLLYVGWPPMKDGWPPRFISDNIAFFNTYWKWVLPAFLLWKYATAFAAIAASVGAYSLIPSRYLDWQAFAGKRSLGIYVNQSWLLPLSIGTMWWQTLMSSALVVAAALAAALFLERFEPTRVLLLGMKPTRPWPWPWRVEGLSRKPKGDPDVI